MDAFSFVFTLFGLVLGLALTEVFSGFGAAMQERHKIRVGWLTPLLGVVVSLDLISFWSFAWFSRKLVPVHPLVLQCALVITGIYYLAARMVFPHDRDEWPDYNEYYFANRHWVIGGILVCNVLLILGQLALGFNPLQLRADQLGAALLFAELVALMIIRNRLASVAILALVAAAYPIAAIISYTTKCGGLCP